MMIKDNRRYYMDLKENARGRFLRVSVYNGIIPRQDSMKQKTIDMDINNI